jgi:type II secretory pathway predicted ATPase ExeA
VSGGRPATKAPAAAINPFRARRYLEDKGVSLGALVARFGWSATTWSRFLNRARPLEGGTAMVERLLEERAIEVPPDLWEPESGRTVVAPGDAPAHRSTPLMSGQTKKDQVLTTPYSEVFMLAQFLSDGARRRFGLFNNPFAASALYDDEGQPRLDHIFLSRAQASVRLLLTQAATGGGFSAVYGPPGTGKTTLRARAMADAAAITEPHRLVVVTPANIERRKMELGHIVMELLRELTDDAVPQATNARDAKLEAVLLRYHKDRHRIVLLIEDAHELRPETLKDLKRLHEGRHGFMPLLGIILIGQPDLGVKLDPARNPLLTEVALRAVKVELPALAEGEIRSYLASRLALVGDRHVDHVFAPAAVAEMERLLATPKGEGQPSRPRTPLVLNNLAVGALNCANARGEDLVTAETVKDVLAAKSPALQAWGAA